MKLNKFFAAFMLTAAALFVSCGTNLPDDPNDGPGPKPQDTTTTPTDTTAAFDWTAANLPEGAITVAQARAVAAALASDGSETTSQAYYVYGIVKKFGTKHESGMNDYGNATFYMVDNTGDSDDFEAYQVYNLNQQKFTSLEQIAVGDHVVVCCHITIYNGTYETAGKGDGYVWWNDNPKASQSGTGGNTDPQPEGVTGNGSLENPYTAADVLTLNNTVTGNYYVRAYIVGQVKGGATSANNNCEFAAPFTDNGNGTNTNILLAASATETNEANVIPVQLPSGALRDGLNLITNGGNLGQEVLIYGSLEKYFGKAGIKSPTYAVIGTTVIGTQPGETPDPGTTEAPEATVATIAEFKAAPVNSTVPGVYYELTGTIGGSINTTYGNFDLIDATDTVYVYGLTATYQVLSTATKANNDKSYASLNLVAGDNVTIRGVRADYNGKIEVLGAYFVRKNN